MAAFLRRHLERLRSLQPRAPGLIEIAGLAAVLAGVYQVYEPAAFMVGGIGAVLWANDRPRGEK